MKIRLIIEDLATNKMLKNAISGALSDYQKKHKITFDTENNDQVEEKTLEIGEYKIICQLWEACGDWENPISYFVCQIESGLLNIDGKMYTTEEIFVYIPIDENPNLVKHGKGFAATEADETDREDPDPQELWSALKKYLEDCQKKVDEIY